MGLELTVCPNCYVQQLGREYIYLYVLYIFIIIADKVMICYLQTEAALKTRLSLIHLLLRSEIALVIIKKKYIFHKLRTFLIPNDIKNAYIFFFKSYINFDEVVDFVY